RSAARRVDRPTGLRYVDAGIGRECFMKLTRKEFLGAAATSGLASLIGSRELTVSAAANPPKKLEKTAIKGATAATVRFIRDTNAAAIPPAVFAQAKRCLIDGFGVILAGSTVR